MTKTDRRVERTREMLQNALIELINERGYDAITIQDIADRANIGRTTFYLHYNNKDELFISCHEAIVGEFHLGPHHLLSKDEMLANEASLEMISAYRHLDEARARLSLIFQSPDNAFILRQIREQMAQEIEVNLRAVFTETDSAIPFDLLANYLGGSQIALVQWWLEKRRPHSAEDLAQTFHRMQRAVICDALGLMDAT